MSKFVEGQRVRISMDAFPDSPDERDAYARGKTGVVTEDQAKTSGAEWEGCYVVTLDDPAGGDGGVYYVIDDEIEAIA